MNNQSSINLTLNHVCDNPMTELLNSHGYFRKGFFLASLKEICYGTTQTRRRSREEGRMEKRTQLSVILTNAPGELSKMCDVLKDRHINILAMSIQNAKDSVKELFNMREKTGRRIALAESYRSILKDSSDYSLIRILVDKPKEAEKVLLGANHLVHTDQVLVFKLINQPGMLGQVAKRFGEAGVNIDYIYGSAMEDTSKAMFIVHIVESDFERVRDLFQDL